MIAIRRILVPIDFSEFARHAADYAFAIARWYGAEVTALHVIPPVTSSLPPAGDGLYPLYVASPAELRQFQTELDAFVRESAASEVTLRSVVAEGSVAGEIARLARELPADLLVMGTHGRSGFDRLLLGSVTEKMLRKSPCPLLTLPRRAADASPLPVLFRRILCAVDFSPSSLEALALAESLAEEADARLTVMHVLEPAPVTEPVVMGGSGGPAVDQDARAAVRQHLESAISQEARIYSHVSEVVMSGKPYRGIVREANERHCDLIVLGAHGSRLPGLALGATANHVVREASCPVLTVRG